MAKILRKSLSSISKISVSSGQKSILHHYYIQNVKDGIEIVVYKINKESTAHSNQFILVEVKRMLRKPQALVKSWLSYKSAM